MGALVLLAALFDRAVHIAHVSTREEILVIRVLKEKGFNVTCEVTPHHLFLVDEDIPHVGSGRSKVKPPLATPIDRASLWDNLDVIDCFATDHSPHTLEEKDGADPPPGFPGLETALPLLLTAVYEKRLSLGDIVTRMVTNPQRIFKLPGQPDTWIEIDPDMSWEIRAANTHTRCAWTPFEGRRVHGELRRVFLRGREAYRDGVVLATLGYGKNLKDERLGC
jgi:carbamoyl-phosphate synthase/aspartate carbamoyltransferase/dihydroorotase